MKASSTLNRKQKLIWAVNPSENPAEAKALVKELKIWAKKLNCDIEPVAVFSKLYLNYPAELSNPRNDNLEDLALASTNFYLKKLPTTGFLKPKILFVTSLSNRRMATELVEYSNKTKPAIIFVNTRLKATMNPFRLGGFAETVMTTSHCPVLLMNPQAESKNQKHAILFPTDFSHESNAALAHIEPWAAAFKSEVVLFNQVEFPDSYSQEFNENEKMKKFMQAAEVARVKKLEVWAEHLKKQNVTARVIVRRERRYVGAEIIKVAKKNKVELIVIASRSGQYAQAILGSVARDVLVQANCPVLVFHRARAKSNFLRNAKSTVSMRNTENIRNKERREHSEINSGA